jgi:hypothetical protein
MAVLIAGALAISGEEIGRLWIMPLLVAFIVWFQYFTTKRRPRIWEVVVDEHSLRYLRNGELIDEIQRTETVGIRCYTSWWSIEGVPYVQLDLRDGRVHNVSVFRLAPEDQKQFVNSVERNWDLTATNGFVPE